MPLSENAALATLREKVDRIEKDSERQEEKADDEKEKLTIVIEKVDNIESLVKEIDAIVAGQGGRLITVENTLQNNKSSSHLLFVFLMLLGTVFGWLITNVISAIGVMVGVHHGA